ncbi:MAG: cell division protein FtsH, partial [Dehalococcoidia bacterium]|nr:cell division protein FtsH [Dehalococcoidia bacterium]
SDIKRATDLARKMITDYGMSDKLAVRTFGGEEIEAGLGQRDYSEEVAREIDHEVDLLVGSANEVARKILHENKERLVYLADTLMDVENLEGRELEKVLSGPVPEKDGVPAKGPPAATGEEARPAGA